MNISPEDFKGKILNNEHLHNGLVVEGTLNLYERKEVTYLPEFLTVEGNLDLLNCRNLTHLPFNLVVKGSLIIRGCNILYGIPTTLVVHGDIYCDEGLLDKIPVEDIPLYINHKFYEWSNKAPSYLFRRLQSIRKDSLCPTT
jgi:hypothetical protein